MKQEVIKLLRKSTKLSEKEVEKFLEIPPSSDLGDYAFPCFSLSKEFKKSPQDIAVELNKKIKLPKSIEKLEVKGPYLNFFLNRKVFARDIIEDILKEKEKFGKINLGKSKKTMVEFSQANTHKAFHVGHIRGTSLGESLARISEFLGYKVIRANYQGDIGMHVAKWIWCYQKYHSKEKVRKEEAWIASIYVDAVKRLAKNKELQKEVEEVNKKLEQGKDKKIHSLWKKTRELSLDSLEKIYKDLNTRFDKYYFESQVQKQGKKIVEDLLKKKVAKISEEATIMDLEKYKLGIWVLLRKDGTLLYSAKDLALAEEKSKKYNLDNSLYVVANEQEFYFKQLVKTLKLMKFKEATKLKHISYGVIRFPYGKMSSRTGENILYSNFLQDLVKSAEKGIKKKWPKISAKELKERALKIAISAMKYPMLKQTPNKNIIFDPKKEIKFEGNTGPYLQYSYARASSILRKAKYQNTKYNIKKVESPEFELVKKLSQYPDIVLAANQHLNPSIISNYAYQLAQNFNEFYHICLVIGSEQEEFRLAIVDSFRIVLKSSLHLLGIETLEEM